jgi:hypothetical protein
MSKLQAYIFNYREANLHILIAIFFGLFLDGAGMAFKFIFMPYILYLMLSRKEENVPGLILMLSYGNILTVFAAFVSIYFSLSRLDKLKKSGYFHFWLILVLMLPVYVVILAMRLPVYGFIGAFQSLEHYIVFWFLVYGVLNSDIVTRRMLNYTVFPYLLLLVLNTANIIPNDSVKILFRMTALVELVIFLMAFKSFRREIDVRSSIYIYLSILFYLPVRMFYFSNYKFTALMALLISLYFIYKKEDFLQFHPKILATKLKRKANIIVVFPVFFTVLTLALTPTLVYNFQNVDLTNYYTGNSNVFEVILGKLFVDRGVLWLSALDTIMASGSFFPSVDIINIQLNLILSSAVSAEEISFGAHNIPLELMRTEGIFFGLILSVLYLIQIRKLIKNTVDNHPTVNIYRFALVGIGIAVFATGMYTVSLNVAFIYMFLTGALALSKDKVLIESNAPRIISAALGFREKEDKRRKKVIREKV